MVSFYYNRFVTFRKVLDEEMKDATKCGIAQKCQMDSREEITEDEEGILWEKGLLGGHSAESLMYTIYFYNGKLFGPRACEHRLLRFCNICVKENLIIFDESLSKTFQGGLKDLKKKPHLIKHKCHEIGVWQHCIQFILVRCKVLLKVWKVFIFGRIEKAHLSTKKAL